ncbi:hypothetical protein OFC51_34725, partial [Escherichia coli]|nr:hypothetical protein [Escherichia coli]
RACAGSQVIVRENALAGMGINEYDRRGCIRRTVYSRHFDTIGKVVAVFTAKDISFDYRRISHQPRPPICAAGNFKCIVGRK